MFVEVNVVLPLIKTEKTNTFEEEERHQNLNGSEKSLMVQTESDASESKKNRKTP